MIILGIVDSFLNVVYVSRIRYVYEVIVVILDILMYKVYDIYCVSLDEGVEVLLFNEWCN